MWGAAFDAEPIEVGPQVSMRALVFLCELLPPRAVVTRISGEGGWQIGIPHLKRVARHDPHTRDAGRDHGGEGDHVVLDDDVGHDLVEDLAQPWFDVPRTID